MNKKCAQEMSLEDFCSSLSTEMLNELTKANISYNRAYSIFKELLLESNLHDDDDIGTMDIIAKNIILDHTEEMLANEFSKYEDWQD